MDIFSDCSDAWTKSEFPYLGVNLDRSKNSNLEFKRVFFDNFAFRKRNMTCSDHFFEAFDGRQMEFEDFCMLTNEQGEKSKKCTNCGCGSHYHAVTNENKPRLPKQPYCRQHFVDMNGNTCEKYNEACKSFVKQDIEIDRLINPFRQG